ncbi:hypothetical protein [Gemmatimonas phototrophica]|uniref:hypothetical protein n=1 Tax=Gemmatimonas phototrophica TaxID=1379270 RepID=UPI00047DA3B6|nr:hypothetical protein [Gemmatimonas phototrophica]
MPVLSSLATAPDFSSIPTPPPTLSLEGLQAQLQAVVVGGRTAGEPFSTGLPALDAALGGGIPRGRITELTGALAVGKTALLRRVVASVLHTGVWVAWIDATRTLTPAPWADLGKRFVVIRLPEGKRAAWTADLLLRSGVFGLVVIDGAPSLSRVHGVRLAQLARERDAACVVLEHIAPGATRRPSRLAGTVRVQVALATPPSLQEPSRWTPLATRRRSRTLVAESPPEPIGPRPSASPAAPPSAFLAASPAPAPAPARLQVTVEKGASLPNCKTIEVDRVVVVARRVCTDSEIPDRRGVARSARRVWTARGNSTDANTEPDRQQQEHPVTWGGLGVGAHDLYGIDVPGHPARLAAGLDLPGDRLPSDRLPGGGDRHEQELDRRTRDWTTYKGRRRAAESSFGRRGRREATRSSPAPLG